MRYNKIKHIFWRGVMEMVIILAVTVLIIGAIFTAGYNEDKTWGL
jgi:ABC-type polysaccharide transport system permease subunit